MLVFELVLTPLAAAPPSSNPLAPQTSAPSGPQLLGWGVVRPFRVGAELPESGGGKTVPVNSVEVAQGTPRALLLLDEPFERIALPYFLLFIHVFRISFWCSECFTTCEMYFAVFSVVKNSYANRLFRVCSSTSLHRSVPSAGGALFAHAAHQLRALHRREHAGRLERERPRHPALLQRPRCAPLVLVLLLIYFSFSFALLVIHCLSYFKRSLSFASLSGSPSVSSEEYLNQSLNPNPNVNLLRCADPFWKPHAAPSTTYFADRLQVFLHPSLEAFEKELLADLAHDRNEREAFNDPTPLQIAERRLRVRVRYTAPEASKCTPSAS